jgi:hypothetical protein
LLRLLVLLVLTEAMGPDISNTQLHRFNLSAHGVCFHDAAIPTVTITIVTMKAEVELENGKSAPPSPPHPRSSPLLVVKSQEILGRR